MKKKLKILGFTLLFLLVLLFALPFVFKGKIIDLVKQTANNNLNARLDFENADLSLLRGFPDVQLKLHDFYIINKEPFAGDTLVKAAEIGLELPFKSLFNDASEAIQINSFSIQNAVVAIQIDSLGNANYDIVKKDKYKETDSVSAASSDSFSFDLKEYNLQNGSLSYEDAKSKTSFYLRDLNHSGKGNLSAEESVLKTKSDALISLALDSIGYLQNHSLNLDADININLKENRYTFLENSAKINELPLVFDGFVQVNEDHQELDITFKTPSSDFKNFLALIPKAYSKNIENVTTTGNFDVTGTIKGLVDETHIPRFNIAIRSNDASFKYPNLPKSLQNIHINTEVVNTTGFSKDTYIDINKLAFKIDDELFNANVQLKDLTENMKVKAQLKGTVDLAKLEQIYPADALKDLQGLLYADISTGFDMNSIEQKRYENTRTSGRATISNFEYRSEELKNPLQVNKTSLDFTPGTVNLKQFDAKIGQTDMQLNGTIKNFLGFLFSNQNLEGSFAMTSNSFVVNDFISAKGEDAEKDTQKPEQEQLKIPSFLDASVNARAATVVYDNITLKNMAGNLKIKDQAASLNNMKSEVFGGQLGFDGLVSTKTETPKFTMKLDAKNFDIGQSFTSLDLFKALAPIANTLAGKINTDITLSGDLKNDFTPVLSSISGDVFAQLLSSKIASEKSPLLQQLTSNLSFFDAKKLNLDDLKASLTFKDGKVAVKPFNLKYDDIEIAVGGNHGFDKTIDYDAIFNVPAKYLGKEAEKLLAQLSVEEQNTIKVPVTALLKGSFTKPSVSTDLKSAVAGLTKQVANNQKDKLVNKGKEELTNALDKLLNKNKDSAKVDSTKTNANDAVKETATSLLKGIFGKKKKKDTIKKDTLN